MEVRQARRATCSAKGTAVIAAGLLCAALLLLPNSAGATGGEAGNADQPSSTTTAVLRGTQPPAPKPAAPARTAAPRRERQPDLTFHRQLPYGSGWNNELNWEGIDSEPQIDTILR